VDETTAIEAIDLRCKFGDFEAVAGVSIHVERSENAGVILKGIYPPWRCWLA
jgi:ABC-type branched-subunit amino acid transport system ATPase component